MLALWWPAAGQLHVGSDDREMMSGSREAAAGNWNRLLSTQGEHFLPLFRLLRLPFDLYFPAGFRWLHALTLAAHAGSVWLVYALSKPHLGLWSALTAAFVFGWNGLGAEALIIKSQNTYVWSLLLVLGALACLVRSRPWATVPDPRADFFLSRSCLHHRKCGKRLAKR